MRRRARLSACKLSITLCWAQPTCATKHSCYLNELDGYFSGLHVVHEMSWRFDLIWRLIRPSKRDRLTFGEVWVVGKVVETDLELRVRILGEAAGNFTRRVRARVLCGSNCQEVASFFSTAAPTII